MIDFTISPDSGDEYKITATSRDIFVWEKAFKGRSLVSLTTQPRMQDLYELAFHTSKRLGLYEGTRADFEAGVDLDFEFTEEPDPSQPGASAEA